MRLWFVVWGMCVCVCMCVYVCVCMCVCVCMYYPRAIAQIDQTHQLHTCNAPNAGDAPWAPSPTIGVSTRPSITRRRRATARARARSPARPEERAGSAARAMWRREPAPRRTVCVCVGGVGEGGRGVCHMYMYNMHESFGA